MTIDAAGVLGTIGPYLLLRRLAGGGMGEVFLAHRQGPAGFEKLAVVKRILPNLVNDEGFVRMFLNEAKLAASLEHPNVVRMYDLGEDDGNYFLAMEYLHGVTLTQLLVAAESQGRRIPLGHALDIIMGVARGLHYAHEKKGLDGKPLGIVHRDISPSNVFITFDGAVKILDFGVARALNATSRITEGDTIKGKVSYMSPEQVKGEDIDRRSDVYAIGILLYELLTARRLYSGENRFAIMNRVAAGQFTPPSTHDPEFVPELEQIILRALAVERSDRYDTALALHGALEEFATQARVTRSPVALAEYLEEVVGHREYPSLQLPEAVAPVRPAHGRTSPASPAPSAATQQTVRVQPDAPARPMGRWIVAAAAGLALGVGAWMYAPEGDSQTDKPAQTDEPDKPDGPDEPSSVAAPLEIDSSSTGLADAAPDATTTGPRAADGTENPEPKDPTPRSKRKRKRKKGAAMRGVDGLLPSR